MTPLHISWCLAPGSTRQGLPWAATPAEWVQCAQAVEYAGLQGIYLPCGPEHPDSLMVAAALCAHTQRLDLGVSLPAEAMLPAALAATVQSLQSLSAGRLRLHVPDSDRGSLRHAYGEALNRDQRNERIDEFLAIVLHLLQQPGTPLDHTGRYYRLENAGLGLRPLAAPPLQLDESLGSARLAQRADTCLLQGGTPPALAARIQALRGAAAAQGRTLGFACHFGIIARASEQQAWAQASHQAAAPQRPAALGSRYPTAQVHELLAERSHHPARSAEVYPNLWQPPGQQHAVLVGSAEQVASRMAELYGLGISEFVLHAPHAVREVLYFGENVLPLLCEKLQGLCP